MDATTQEKFWALYAQFWTNAKILRDPVKRKAWALVLEKYDYQPVMGRLLELAATSKYPPDLAEITGPLTRPKAAPAGATRPTPGTPGEANRRVRNDALRMREFLAREREKEAGP